MRDASVSRRSFLKSVVCAPTIAANSAVPAQLPDHVSAAVRRHDRLRIGGEVFVRSEDPADLAQAHRDQGFRAAFAPDVKLADKYRIRSIVKEFAQRDVVLAEVGAWVNLLDPDDAKRKRNQAYVEQQLAVAEELGALCCVDIAGSYDPNVWYGPHPKNISEEFIDATVENCRKLIDAVKPTRTRFSIEMMPFNFPSGPDDYLRLIKAVDRRAFAVHLDVCNVINSPRRMYDNGAIIRECFRKLGPWIVSCHAKDLRWEAYYQVCLREVIPGQGSIDYAAYLTGLAQLTQEVPLMLEHLETAEEYAQGRKYIRSVAQALSLSLDADAS